MFATIISRKLSRGQTLTLHSLPDNETLKLSIWPFHEEFFNGFNFVTFHLIYPNIFSNLLGMSFFPTKYDRINLRLQEPQKHHFLIHSIVILPWIEAILDLLLQVMLSLGMSQWSRFIISMFCLHENSIGMDVRDVEVSKAAALLPSPIIFQSCSV